MTDREIMEIYASGDSEAAFNAIVQSYGERLYWHVRHFTCSHEDSDDLLQDIFIKVWKALPGFRSESSLYTWIYRIATNETLNFLRKKRLRALLSAESLETLLDRRTKTYTSTETPSSARSRRRSTPSRTSRNRSSYCAISRRCLTKRFQKSPESPWVRSRPRIITPPGR